MGSVVFVDISGFTKLSEKLAKVGKEGAEQVTDAIEACFTDLLSVAYANDGSLIKFGGDALLLLFEGDDHVANACRSAVWMRRALARCGPDRGAGLARPAPHVRGRPYRHATISSTSAGRIVSWSSRARVDRHRRHGTHRGGGRDPREPAGRGGVATPVPRGSEGAGVPPEARAAGTPRGGGDPDVRRRPGRGGALPVDGGADPRAGRRRHAGAPADLDRVHPLRRHRRDDRGAGSCGRRRRTCRSCSPTRRPPATSTACASCRRMPTTTAAS